MGDCEDEGSIGDEYGGLGMDMEVVIDWEGESGGKWGQHAWDMIRHTGKEKLLELLWSVMQCNRGSVLLEGLRLVPHC